MVRYAEIVLNGLPINNVNQQIEAKNAKEKEGGRNMRETTWLGFS